MLSYMSYLLLAMNIGLTPSQTATNQYIFFSFYFSPNEILDDKKYQLRRSWKFASIHWLKYFDYGSTSAHCILQYINFPLLSYEFVFCLLCSVSLTYADRRIYMQWNMQINVQVLLSRSMIFGANHLWINEEWSVLSILLSFFFYLLV